MVNMHWLALSIFEVLGIFGGFLAGLIWMSKLTIHSMAVDPEWWHLTVTKIQELHAAHGQKQDRA